MKNILPMLKMVVTRLYSQRKIAVRYRALVLNRIRRKVVKKKSVITVVVIAMIKFIYRIRVPPKMVATLGGFIIP